MPSDFPTSDQLNQQTEMLKRISRAKYANVGNQMINSNFPSGMGFNPQEQIPAEEQVTNAPQRSRSVIPLENVIGSEPPPAGLSQYGGARQPSFGGISPLSVDRPKMSESELKDMVRRQQARSPDGGLPVSKIPAMAELMLESKSGLSFRATPMSGGKYRQIEAGVTVPFAGGDLSIDGSYGRVFGQYKDKPEIGRRIEYMRKFAEGGKVDYENYGSGPEHLFFDNNRGISTNQMSNNTVAQPAAQQTVIPQQAVQQAVIPQQIVNQPQFSLPEISPLQAILQDFTGIGGGASPYGSDEQGRPLTPPGSRFPYIGAGGGGGGPVGDPNSAYETFAAGGIVDTETQINGLMASGGLAMAKGGDVSPLSSGMNIHHRMRDEFSKRGLDFDGFISTKAEARAAAEQLKGMGNNGDTILAHINPREAALLKEYGGSGTVNPRTGLLQFDEGEGRGDGPDSSGNTTDSPGNNTTDSQSNNTTDSPGNNTTDSQSNNTTDSPANNTTDSQSDNTVDSPANMPDVANVPDVPALNDFAAAIMSGMLNASPTPTALSSMVAGPATPSQNKAAYDLAAKTTTNEDGPTLADIAAAHTALGATVSSKGPGVVGINVDYADNNKPDAQAKEAMELAALMDMQEQEAADKAAEAAKEAAKEAEASKNAQMQEALNSLAAEMGKNLNGFNLAGNLPSVAQTTNDAITGQVNTGIDRGQLAFGTPSINTGLSSISADIATALGGKPSETPNAASTANLSNDDLTAAVVADAAAKVGTPAPPSTSTLASLSTPAATPAPAAKSAGPTANSSTTKGKTYDITGIDFFDNAISKALNNPTATLAQVGLGLVNPVAGLVNTVVGNPFGLAVDRGISSLTGKMPGPGNSVASFNPGTNPVGPLNSLIPGDPSYGGGGTDVGGAGGGGTGVGGISNANALTATTPSPSNQLISDLYGRKFLGLPNGYEDYGSRGAHKFYTNYQKVAKGGLIGPLSNVRNT